MLEGIAGDSVDKIDALLQENLLSNLSDQQKKLLENLLKRLKGMTRQRICSPCEHIGKNSRNTSQSDWNPF